MCNSATSHCSVPLIQGNSWKRSEAYYDAICTGLAVADVEHASVYHQLQAGAVQGIRP